MPSGILTPDKMQAVFWDILRADAFIHDYQAKDSFKNATVESVKLQKKVFALHKVTKEQFYNSYDYYKAHTELMKGILDSMINKANRDRGRLDRLTHPMKEVSPL